MINILNNALKETSKQSLKMRLVSMNEMLNIDEIQREISELIKTLKSQTTDFMLIGHFCIKSNENMSAVLKEDQCLLIRSEIDEDTIWTSSHKLLNFVISNNQCKIGGYQEKWLMECSRCKQPLQ